MRSIVHLSDLHFGSAEPGLLEPLRGCIEDLRPDLIAVSGDLTQRARDEQFAAARDFLDSLPQPQLVVPGNHDVPLYNVVKRFWAPFDGYRRHISPELEPQRIDAELAVVGVNTARSLTFKGGRINHEQVARVRALLCDLEDRVTKVVVTHHPFDVPEHIDEDGHLVGRAAMAAEGLARCGVDILLAGHLHTSHIAHAVSRYTVAGFSALIVQAGTATSTRARGEPNSFNVLRVEHPHLQIEQYAWDGRVQRFAAAKSLAFERHADGWGER
jgi:3',5'-cyclic AMP phosphodiesterase CpdA